MTKKFDEPTLTDPAYMRGDGETPEYTVSTGDFGGVLVHEAGLMIVPDNSIQLRAPRRVGPERRQEGMSAQGYANYPYFTGGTYVHPGYISEGREIHPEYLISTGREIHPEFLP
jgi:hypothetical protein